jgi:RNA recognition motif-containing protein
VESFSHDEDGASEAERQEYLEVDKSGARLFVSGLAPSVDDERLFLAFEPFGDLLEWRIARPGLGYVIFAAPTAADFALEKMQVISG